MRHTPAGVPVATCLLAHQSQQEEAGQMREVAVEIKAVALGELAQVLAAVQPETRVQVRGFLAAKSLRSRSPVLHLHTIQFVEGN